MKEFQETVRLAPDSPLANFWLGKAYYFKKDRDTAEKLFKKVLQMDPKNYHAMAMLGQLYSLQRDKLDQAQQYLQQALEESPDNLEAHFDMGRVLAMKGERQRAVLEFNFIFAKEADFAPYHFEMGRILEAWGEKERALANYKRALVLNPQFTMASQAVQRLEKGEGAPKPTAPESKSPATKPAAPSPR